MFEAVTSSPFFGLALTLGCWCLGVELQRRTGLLICNPVLVASLLVIGALTVLRVPLECYNAGGGLVKLMLGPATAVLALNIYQQRQVLREHFLPRVSGGQRRQHGLRATAVPAVPRRGDACCLHAA